MMLFTTLRFSLFIIGMSFGFFEIPLPPKGVNSKPLDPIVLSYKSVMPLIDFFVFRFICYLINIYIIISKSE